jgi:hypothetical protein
MRLWTAAPPFDKWFGMLTILSLSKEGGQEGFYDQCRYYYETLICGDPDRDILIIDPDSKSG